MNCRRRSSRVGTSGGIGMGGIPFVFIFVSVMGSVRRAWCCFSCISIIAVSRSFTFLTYSSRFWMYCCGYVNESDIGIMSEYCGILFDRFLESVDALLEPFSDDMMESGVSSFVFGWRAFRSRFINEATRSSLCDAVAVGSCVDADSASAFIALVGGSLTQDD